MDITVTFTIPDSAAAEVLPVLLKHATMVTPIAEGSKRKQKAEPAPGLDFSAPATPPSAAPVPASAPPGTVTAAQLGVLVTEFMERMGVPATRAVFAMFGVKKLPDLPPEKFGAFVAEMQSQREVVGK